MIRLQNILSESTKTEYIVWGVPPGKRDEEILYTKAKSITTKNPKNENSSNNAKSHNNGN